MAWTSDQVSARNDIYKNGTDVSIDIKLNAYNVESRRVLDKKTSYKTRAIFSIISKEESTDPHISSSSLKIFIPSIGVPDLIDYQPENISMQYRNKIYVVLKIVPIMPDGNVILYKLFFK